MASCRRVTDTVRIREDKPKVAYIGIAWGGERVRRGGGRRGGKEGTNLVESTGCGGFYCPAFCYPVGG